MSLSAKGFVAPILVLALALSSLTIWTQRASAATPVFAGAINLSMNRGNSTFPVMAVSEGNVYVAWQDNTPRNDEVFFAVSHNSGSSFGPVTNMSSDPGGSFNPELAVSGSYAYIVWQDNSTGNDEILFRASSNNGTSFFPTIDVSNTTLSSDYPQVAASGNNVYVVWEEATNRGPPEILLRASGNNGANWSPTKNLSSNSGNSLYPQIAASETQVYVTWEDDTPKTPQTFFIVSNDGGATFGSAVALTTDTASSFNQKIVARDNDVYVAWQRVATTGNIDIIFRASINRGSSFSSAFNVSSTGRGTIPQMAASGASVYLVWEDFSRVNPQTFFRGSNNNGTSFNPTINLSNDANDDTDQQIAASGLNVYTTWDDTGQTYFISSDNSGGSFSSKINLSNDTGTAVNPAIAASGNNVYVTWQDNTPGNLEILFRSSASVSQPFDFSLSNSGGITVNQGASGPNTITVSLVSGTPQSVTLSCASGLPAGASCTFAATTGFPTFSSTLTIATSFSTPTGPFTITVTGTGGGLTHTTQFALTVNSPGTVGGVTVPVDKLALLAPFLAFATVILVSTGAAVAYFRQKRRRS